MIYSDHENTIRNTVLPAITKKYAVSLKNLSGTQLIKYEKGGRFVPHKDIGTGFPDRCFTVLTYLNDGYTGGQTSFPQHGYAHVPVRGQTLAFFSDYLHASEVLEEGVKYVLATWVTSEIQQRWI